jgi:hypothetical protein
MRALLVTLLALVPACVNHRHFVPREYQNGESPEGYPAAVYALQGDGAKGEVRVWSAGSAPRNEAGDSAELHLGFELENTGERPLQLDVESLRCDELRADERVLGPLRAVRVTGSADAPPGKTVRLDAWFEPEAGIGPVEIDSFAARFVVHCAEQAVCSQATPFVPYVIDLSRYGDDDGWLWGCGHGFVGHCHSGHRCH